MMASEVDGMETPQKVTAFHWTKAKSLAAQSLAEDVLTDEEIAAKAGVCRKTIHAWKQRPEFAAKVNELADQLGEVAQRHALGRVGRRVQALTDRWERMLRIIKERSESPEMANVPGGKTGLLVRNVKAVGKGDDFQLIELYEVDAALLKELREHEKQVAHELGQWVDRKELTGKDGEPFFKFYGFDPTSPPERTAHDPKRLTAAPPLAEIDRGAAMP
jgi:hypothetical protein